METIMSLKNQLIKDMVHLQDRKTRQNLGLYMVEGLKMLQEAVMSGISIDMVFADKEHMQEVVEITNQCKTYMVTLEILSKLSEMKTPQGIIAVVKLPELKESIAFHGKKVLLLDRVQDPGNVGTMIRTADACGFDMVILSSDSADPWQPKALRASMGSIWHIDVEIASSSLIVVARAKESGLKTLAAHPRDSRICWDEPMSMPLLLVIGNEASGISEEMLHAVDTTLMIPMEGKAESLNAANAAAMIMYEILRQRAK